MNTNNKSRVAYFLSGFGLVSLVLFLFLLGNGSVVVGMALGALMTLGAFITGFLFCYWVMNVRDL